MGVKGKEGVGVKEEMKVWIEKEKIWVKEIILLKYILFDLGMWGPRP